MNKTIIVPGNPDRITVETENRGSFRGPFSEDRQYAGDVTVSIRREREYMAIDITADETWPKYIRLRWNGIEMPGRGCRILGDAWERGYSDLEWRGMSANRFMPWYFLASDRESVTGYGVKVRPASFCFWQADPAGITLFMDVRCGGSGVRLGGRTITAACVIMARFDECSVFEGAQAFCRLMCSDPVLPVRPVYGSNNWYYAYGISSEQDIIKDTEYLASLTQGLENRPYMVIDDGWQLRHDEELCNGGPWRAGNDKFPDMQRMAAEIAERGAIPGIWMRPLLNTDEEIPDEWRLSTNGCLDPTYPDALHYIKEDIRTICGWGFRLIKHDFSTYDLTGKWGFEMHPLVTEDGWHFYDRSITTAEAVTRLYHAIWDASHEKDFSASSSPDQAYGAVSPNRAYSSAADESFRGGLQGDGDNGTIIIGCNTVGHLGAGLMQLDRIGDDTSGLGWERTRSTGINTLAFRLMQNETFFGADADCVGIMGRIPWKFNRQWADVIARSGTPLFISAKPGVLTEEENQELAAILKMAAEGEHRAVPLDWMDNDCPQLWKDGEEIIEYSWYEEDGVQFGPERNLYTPYLSGY